MEVTTILWREWKFFKHRFVKITAAQLVTPLLYLVTFGLGLGNDLLQEGQPYLLFLLPGILSMTTMRSSYTAISTRISVTRLHEKSFESFVYSPTRMPLLAIGHIVAGALRGMYAGVGVIIIGLISGAAVNIGWALIAVLFLNCLTFSSMGFFIAMVINTHYDLNNFTNMIITPMSFLCGTFFSLNNVPFVIKEFINFLPLTHTTVMIRQLALGLDFTANSLYIALLYACAFILLSIIACYKEIKD